MPLTLNSMDPVLVSAEGGAVVTLTGTFTQGDTYAVTVGGQAAYGGVPGEGAVIRPNAALTELKFVVPAHAILLEGGAYTVNVTGSPSAESATRTLVISNRPYYGEVYKMRRKFPPRAATGARRVDLEPVNEIEIFIPS